MKLKNAVFNMPFLVSFKTFSNFYSSFWVLSSYYLSFPRWGSSQLLYLWLHRFWPQWWSVSKRRIHFQPWLAQSLGCESPVALSAGLTQAQLYSFVLPTAVVSSNQAASLKHHIAKRTGFPMTSAKHLGKAWKIQQMTSQKALFGITLI